MFKRLTNWHQEYIVSTLLKDVEKEKIFVEYAPDSTRNKIHIESLSYHVFLEFEVEIRKDSQFDLYYDPNTKEVSFSAGLIKTRPEAAKQLFDLAQKKLQDPAYYSRRLNDLRRKLTKVKKEYEKACADADKYNGPNISAIAMGAMASNSL